MSQTQNPLLGTFVFENLEDGKKYKMMIVEEVKDDLNKPTKVYIAGEIGGLPVETFTNKFNYAKEVLIKKGFDAISPLDFEHNHGKTWAEYMLEDLRYLNECDAICLLPCWVDSPGANIERQFALGAKKQVLYFEDLKQKP